MKQRQETAYRNALAFQQNSNEQTKFIASRFSHRKILKQALRVWQDPIIAEPMAEEASQIIKTIHLKNRIFLSGKSEKGLLSGLFYLLGIKNEARKTQREIARGLNTNDVTVRNSYRDWLNIHPELST
jgi:transcription initiation factor TFIIIB Brf1 subunit/transcription initiation factor TFIIB